MPTTVTQEVYEIRSISPVHINPSITEGTQNYESILGPKRAISLERYAPIFLVAPSIIGEPGIPSTLFCTPGVVDAAPSAQRHYQWYIDGVASLEGDGDAFAYFLTNPSMDAKEITCLVTATNRVGSADAMSNGLVVSLIEPVIVGEFHEFGITGMGAADSVTVFMDQIAVLTGMWVDDFVTVFEADAFAVTGIAMEEQVTTSFYDIYTVNTYELLDDISISNNGAESGTTGWTVTAGTLRSVATTTPSGGGSYVFMGTSANNVDMFANKTVSISSLYHDEIDTGDCTMVLKFWACQDTSGQFGDTMSMTMNFLNAGDVVLETHNYFGEFEPPGKSRNGTNIWGLYAAPPVAVPVGTTKVNIEMFINGRSRSVGSYCQIDLISLQLYQPVV